MDIYPPGDDSRLILEVLKKIVRPGMRVLDVGTGSGILAEAAREMGANVLASDINPIAVEAAKSKGLEAVHSDLFSNIESRFDLIVFNPPYLELSEEERIGEPIELALDGGKKGREVLDRFLKSVREHLKKGGRVLFLQTERNGIEETKELLDQLGFNYEIVKKRYVPFEGNLVVFLAWRKTDGH